MKKFKNSYLYKLLVANFLKFKVSRNPEKEIRRTYYKVYHHYPNLEEPNNLIEKISWLQLHTDTTLWTKCADKYAMREYVEKCGYLDFLPKNYGCWESADSINFDELPKEFVLKTNNGCGTVLIVRDKSKLNIKKTIRKLRQWMRIPYGWSGAELHYTRIKPCIIAEELLHQDEEQKSFSPESMVDYKVWCINGEPVNILIVYGRDDSEYGLDLYDTEWNRISDKLKKNGHFKFKEEGLQKPKCLDEMLEMSKKMSESFPEVRVDFYVIDGKPVIGELTFSTGYGYFTDEYYEYLGNILNISNLQQKRGGVSRLFNKFRANWMHFKYNKIHNHKKALNTRNNAFNRSITDYKVWCFNGKPECILVIHDRVGSGYLMDMYDTNWERIPNSLKQNAHNGVTGVPLEKPACLEQMLVMAAKLSQPFVQVRVDFYIIKNKPIIGELTFTSGYGNYTDEFYDYLGSKIVLPTKVNKKI